MWVKQKKEIDHKFEKIGKHVSYATEVTAYMEKFKIKKLTGVKSKELLIWISVVEIFVDDPPTEKITMKTPSGIYRTFPRRLLWLKRFRRITRSRLFVRQKISMFAKATTLFRVS